MEDKEFDYMNVIPLVDIMLVLLTIVLTTATFININTIDVSLPEAENSVSPVEKDSFVISIDKEGKYYINKKLVNLTDIVQLLKTKDKDIQISINADKGVSLEHFVKLMDMLKREGFYNIKLFVKSD